MSSSQIIFTLSLFILVFSSLGLAEQQEPSDSDVRSELLALQLRSRTGIVRLDDDSVSRFLTSVPTPRPYTLVIFFDFAKLHSDPDLYLSTVLYEYSLLAKSFVSNQKKTASQRLFFCDLEYSVSNSSFTLFMVNRLPHLSVVLPHVTSMKESDSLNLTDNILWRAEHMAEFIESTMGIIVGRIARPTRFSRMQINTATAVTLITVPFSVKKIIRGDTFLRNKAAWLVDAVSVYFFSVSGLMFNIIRKMPMFYWDKNDPPRIMFFVPGSGRQSGVEGLAVGLLYTLVGLVLAGITHGLVKVENKTVRQVVMVVAMVMSVWAVGKVVKLDNWKTGSIMELFAETVSDVAHQIAVVLAKELGHESTFFLENCLPSTCYLRMNRYPPCPMLFDIFGRMPLTDTDYLTIHLQDEVGGLQLIKDGKWIAVKPNSDALIIHIGDLFQVWSNDVCKSVENKVVSNPRAETFSTAYFLCPSYNTIITSCSRPAVYRNFSFGEYRQPVQLDVKDLGYKIGVPRFLQ